MLFFRSGNRSFLLGELFYTEHFSEEKAPEFWIVNNYYLHKNTSRENETVSGSTGGSR